MKKIYTVLLACVFFMIISCLQEIPIETNRAQQNLVVSGSIDNLGEEYSVRLQRTVAYGVAPTKVAGARIILHENETNEYEFHEHLEGEYILAQSIFNGIIGATYFLTIELENGNKYQTDKETMLLPVTADSVSWSVVTKSVTNRFGFYRNFDAIDLKIHTPINRTDQVYLKWDVKSAFQFTTLPECNPFKNVFTCYYSKGINPGEPMIYSNQSLKLNYLAGFKIGYESISPEYPFMETHVYSAYQQRISKSAYDYFNRLSLVSNQNGTIFDAIPASVKGNVHNIKDPNEEILGYFLISSASIIRARIIAADLDGKYPLPSKEFNLCGWLFGILGTPYFSACCDCGTLPEPIINRPSWW